MVIGEWVCRGPKDYGYRSYICANTGFTMSSRTVNVSAKGWTTAVPVRKRSTSKLCANLCCSPSVMKQQMRNGLAVTQTISYLKFEIKRGLGNDGVCERKFELTSSVVEKKYRLYFDKRVVLNGNYCTYPFGYMGPLLERVLHL